MQLQRLKLMSAQTLIIFVVFKLPKHTKTIKKLSKYLNYPRDCVLCVLKAKWAKTNEKQLKFAILAVSVPQVSKLVKNSPYTFILKGKVNPSFWKSNITKYYTWVISFQNLHVWSLRFWKWQNRSLGILKKWKNENLVLGLWNCGNIGPHKQIGETTFLVPQVL